MTSAIDVDDPARTWATEVGGAAYAIDDGWFHLYFRETLPGGAVLGLSVARARVSDVEAAAAAGRAAPWVKYGRTGWTEPAVGGAAVDLLPDAPAPRWFDVVWMDQIDRFVMVQSDGAHGAWTYVLWTSPDGVTWSSPVRVPAASGDDEVLYLSLSSPDLEAQRHVDGPVLDIYRTRTSQSGWSRWTGEIVLERLSLELTV